MGHNDFESKIPQISLLNHKELFEANALALGQVYSFPDLMYTDCGPSQHAMVVLLADKQTDVDLDKMIDTYTDTSNPMPKTIGVWRRSNSDTHEISSQLLSRGFQLGWEPQWMGLELKDADLDQKEMDGVVIRRVEPDENLVIPAEVPFSSLDDNSIYVRGMWKDGTVVKFVAEVEEKIVGHTDIFFGTSPGMYNVGVNPEYTNRGIATELVKMACKYARNDRGANNVTLNGTGTVMYERIGFKHASNGSTWWLHREKYQKNTPEQQRIIWLVCQGDVQGLDKYSQSLQFPLANGMSLVELALHFENEETARWLVRNDAPHSIVDLWDLGGISRAITEVDLVNKVVDEGKTALHVAVERGDEDFVQFLLKSGADTTIQDGLYKSTPVGWAKVLGRTEIETMIEAHMRDKKPEPSNSR
ncbi:hypothetical protein B0I72DRAFT_132141 [Yarrowia lipolytica]|uniref:YALI0F22319p n=2 Tax=Yarrowia lipolytica TaxID=4952 RepID=Q6C0R8_YARLI|nr:YALI0F22319p [Yarrowia lipolytica CLIB122]AOW07559.1 hypothetical protein YALI1_F29596g [Yarrowia lipolytica]KAB8281308.1 hypothetical protein BKA91DRAFT_140416 [Yarrowia lipolytica]KAE8170590.1 hypothetical protein BKA90DRAFT_140568 [Yarrowia lipolytica]KAJ8055373.1 hypothetical protein LXG23DRAFT_19275 [Yarrowia lipolytica]QNP99757.1 Hypothetical protein YALI2_E01073g [Yarrowia lipolytica]|eukprot:XP_505744.1 YALI0F22319p [Yarrowia lipolytica CLIB122]